MVLGWITFLAFFETGDDLSWPMSYTTIIHADRIIVAKYAPIAGQPRLQAHHPRDVSWEISPPTRRRSDETQPVFR